MDLCAIIGHIWKVIGTKKFLSDYKEKRLECQRCGKISVKIE